MSYFGGHWYPGFGFLVTSPLGYKVRVGYLISIAEVNAINIPCDPPLVLQFKMMAQCHNLLVCSQSLGLELNTDHMHMSVLLYHSTNKLIVF